MEVKAVRYVTSILNDIWGELAGVCFALFVVLFSKFVSAEY